MMHVKYYLLKIPDPTYFSLIIKNTVCFERKSFSTRKLCLFHFCQFVGNSFYHSVNIPPHIQVLNESSRFSPPQMSKPLSYVPRRSKKARSIEKRPPAMVGDQTGSAGFLCLFFSRSGTACQLN